MTFRSGSGQGKLYCPVREICLGRHVTLLLHRAEKIQSHKKHRH